LSGWFSWQSQLEKHELFVNLKAFLDVHRLKYIAYLSNQHLKTLNFTALCTETVADDHCAARRGAARRGARADFF
jgi:hypothetical protein